MLGVYLYGKLAGTIGLKESGITAFTFDHTYVADPDRATLSLSMLNKHREPRAPGRSAFQRLPSFFSNLLPEGRLRSYLAEHGGVNERDEMALIALLGSDLPGAVTVLHNGEEPEPLHHRAGASDSGTLRFSLAGVQLKLSALAADDAKGLTIPVGGVGGNWIVKLPSQRFARLPETEAATMTFAAAVGIDVPEHRVIPVNSIQGLPGGVTEGVGNAYAVRRYDRTDDGGRMHQEDFAQVLGTYPDNKYGLPNAVPLARIIAEACGPDDARELVRRLVFNIAIGNGDAHLKNFSVIYPDRRNARLAPAYDLVPTRRYVSDDGPAVPVVQGRRWGGIGADEFATLADEAGLSRMATMATVRETVERIHATWPAVRDAFDADTQHSIERQLATVPLLGGTPTATKRPHRGSGAG